MSAAAGTRGGLVAGRGRARVALRGCQHGSAVIEYCLVAMLAILVLISTDENVVEMLFTALQEMYAAFTYAMSMTYPTPD